VVGSAADYDPRPTETALRPMTNVGVSRRSQAVGLVHVYFRYR
jgi:hypothetical protein